MASGDIAGGDGAYSDEEAAWRELVAHYDTPAHDGAAPWPERENLPGPAQMTGLAAEPQTREFDAFEPFAQTAEQAEPARGPGPEPAPGPEITHGPGSPPEAAPPGCQRPLARRAYNEPDPGEDHYIPPPPPPLPKLDPITKGAWLALFGGPAYLLIATAIGWAVPGVAAFCAVAAFVGGFAVLVLRMDGGPPRDSGGDDGAVV